MPATEYSLTLTDFERTKWDSLLAGAEKHDTFSYRIEFGKAHLKAKEEGDVGAVAVFTVLIIVTDVQLNADNTEAPFGPRFVRQTARALESGDLTNEQFELLRQLIPTIADPEMRSRVCDIFWTCKRGDPEMARKAVSAYLESATRVEDAENWVACEERIRRAVRLAKSLGGGGIASFTKATAHVETLLVKLNGEDKGFLSNRLMELLQEFRVGDPVKHSALAAKAAVLAEGDGDFRRARFYWQCAAGWHGMAKDANQRETALISSAETHAKDSEAASNWPKERFPNIHAAGELQQAIQALRKVGSPTAIVRANALYPRLTEHQKKSLSELITTSHPVDLTEMYRLAEEAVSGKSPEAALVTIAGLTRPAVKADLRSRVEKSYSSNFLLGFMGMTKLSNTGKIMAERPGFESSKEAKERAITAEMYSHAQHNRWFVAQGCTGSA